MARIPIYPFDNDRLKTRKVRANLAELDALPSDSTEQPSFLKARRSVAALIDRALASLAPTPLIARASANSRAFARDLNEKFNTAFANALGGGGTGGGLPPSNVLTLNGEPLTLNGQYLTLGA